MFRQLRTLLYFAFIVSHFFDKLGYPGNFVATKNVKTFSTIKNAVDNLCQTTNAKRNFLIIKSTKAIFGTLWFKPGKQALDAQGTQPGGTKNPKGPLPWGTLSRDSPTEPPITLDPNKNPFRQSLIGEKQNAIHEMEMPFILKGSRINKTMPSA